MVLPLILLHFPRLYEDPRFSLRAPSPKVLVETIIEIPSLLDHHSVDISGSFTESSQDVGGVLNKLFIHHAAETLSTDRI